MSKTPDHGTPEITLPRRVVRRIRYELDKLERVAGRGYGMVYERRRRVAANAPAAALPEGPLRSSICRQDQLESRVFRSWAERMRSPFRLHRKLWEFCYIAQALQERGMLVPGKRGLGFAVGHEPLPALFASMGCEIVATDLAQEQAAGTVWAETDQHARSLADLNREGLCPPDEFGRLVSFRPVDMNAIPHDLRGFDFLWSSCSLEHLGSLKHGAEFIQNALACLGPGGVAVHTTEFNLSSNGPTTRRGGSVIFRRRDLRAIASGLRSAGHHVEELDFTEGCLPADFVIDPPPYEGDVHLRLRLGDHVATSMGLIIRKADGGGRPASP